MLRGSELKKDGAEDAPGSPSPRARKCRWIDVMLKSALGVTMRTFRAARHPAAFRGKADFMNPIIFLMTAKCKDRAQSTGRPAVACRPRLP